MSKSSSNKWSDGTGKVTCLAIGDPHFQDKNVPDAKELIIKINKLVEKLQPTFVVILGDLLHTHEKIYEVPFNLATEFVTSLATKVHVFLIIGNHDYCLAKDTPVLMWNGTVKLSQDVRIGDQLVGDDYTPRSVKNLTCGKARMYTIKQQTGMEYTVTGHHMLSLKYDNQLHSTDDTIDITVEDYLSLPENKRNQLYGYRSLRDGSIELDSIKISEQYIADYYGWELDSNHRFLLGDRTVTHNCNNQQFLTDKHPFNSFKYIDNITVCDRVILKTINDMKFVFCPYTPPERFEEALCTIEDKGKCWDDATCIFAHQEFYGCRFNPVKTSTEGDIWPEDYPLVVSGHIHNEQWLQPNIYYTGSSMQHAFGEGAKKTIALFTFKSNCKPDLKKLDLMMRRKKIVYIDIEDIDSFIPVENVYIKLVIQGTSEQFKIFRRGQKYKELQKLGVAISFSPTNDPVKVIRTVEKKSVLDILEDMIEQDNKYVHRAFKELRDEYK